MANIRFNIGQKLAQWGNAWKLPEYGISEKIGGYNKTYDYQPVNIGWKGASSAKAAAPTNTFSYN